MTEICLVNLLPEKVHLWTRINWKQRLRMFRDVLKARDCRTGLHFIFSTSVHILAFPTEKCPRLTGLAPSLPLIFLHCWGVRQQFEMNLKCTACSVSSVYSWPVSQPWADVIHFSTRCSLLRVLGARHRLQGDLTQPRSSLAQQHLAAGGQFPGAPSYPTPAPLTVMTLKTSHAGYPAAFSFSLSPADSQACLGCLQETGL